MDQLKNLIEIRDAARIRIDQAKAELRAQFLALESSADAKLVSSLSILIIELGNMDVSLPRRVPVSPIHQNSSDMEKVAENALIDALADAQRATTVQLDSSIDDQILGTATANADANR